MREAVIVDACRSPIGRAGDRGVFRAIGHTDMMVPVLKAIVERNKLNPAMIDDVTMGSVALQGIRLMLLVAGFPESIAGSDTTRQCASSTQAIAIAAHSIMNDDADICIAAGLETMDRQGPLQPWQVGRRGAPQMGAFSRGPALTEEQKAATYPEGYKTANNKLLPFLPPGMPMWIWDMGRTAEELSERFGIKREDSDAFALTSHQKAVAAQDAGLFKSQIVPITISYDDGSTEVIDKDQCPRRDTSLERLAVLPPSYKENGLVTAGNSCPRSDGAGAVLLMSKEKAKQLGLKPMCTFRHAVAVGVDPTVMGIGPVPSTQKILARTGMKIDDFDIIEINEAFSCQVVYSIRHLGVNTAKLNPLGGAVAIGHPLGMTGTRQTANIAHEMVRRNLRWGLATLCVGGGQGMATIFEREKSY
ncbi:MAG TPA: thiolase family protein [Dehalococcoidales bacterium]